MERQDPGTVRAKRAHTRSRLSAISFPDASRVTCHAVTIFRTAWGWMGIAASEDRAGICRIVLPQPSRRAVEAEIGPWKKAKPAGANGQTLREAQRQLIAFLEGKRSALDLPVDLSIGTPFQRRVWRAALRIPYGRVRSYKWVAAKIGGQRYARAVGLALGANPVPIMVPCHRVVAHDGSLGGFSCGLKAKRRLLALEGTLAQLKS